MAYRRNYKTQRHLSIADLDALMAVLERKAMDYPKLVSNIAEEVGNLMLEEVRSGKYNSKYGGNPYVNTQKEVTLGKNKATVTVSNHDAKALFYEMGTGVVGSNHPAVSDYVDKFKWVYDHHGKGEDGWWYPTTSEDPNPYKWTDKEGQLRAWTKGLQAMNGFYNASRLVEQNIYGISIKALSKM